MYKRHHSEALTRALDDLRREWGFPLSFGLRQIVQRWERFVRNVEAGYAGGLDDYLQNLEIRDSLNTLLKRLPPEEREEVAALLSRWDERLRFSTRPTSLSLAPHVDEFDRFWWNRVPLKLTERLLEDLQKEGLV
jgi:hypothetical protein